MTNSSESDFPHFDNTNMMLEMEVGKGYDKSNIALFLQYGDIGYHYFNRFNNEDGFFKFISSQHGYVLERLP